VPERVLLVFSGGNALGAYQAGAYAALHEHGVIPERVAGVSVGAVNAALVAATPPERRVEALRAFWEEAGRAMPDWLVPPHGPARRLHNRLSALQNRLFGNAAVFLPRLPALVGWEPSFYDLAPLRARIERFIDFDRLNASPVGLLIGATDVVSGDEVRFDTRTTRIGAEHLLASCGFLPDFPPVEVDGRLLCDGGMSANLPLSAVLEEPLADDRLCIAVDLYSRRAEPPRTVGEAMERQLDLMLANQTRSTVAALKTAYDLRAQLHAARGESAEGAVTLLALSYRSGPHDEPMKSFDYSRATLLDRMEAGRRDMETALARLATQRRHGFSVLDVTGTAHPDIGTPETPRAAAS